VDCITGRFPYGKWYALRKQEGINMPDMNREDEMNMRLAH